MSRSSGRLARRIIAVAGSSVLLAGLGIAGAPAAAAADADTSASRASAQFLSGTWNSPGVNAAFDGATSAGSVTDFRALASVVAGDAVNIGVGTEYANAQTAGASWAAAGGVTAAGSPADPASIDIDLGKILNEAGIKNDFVEKLTLSLHGIAAIAKLDVGDPNFTGALATDCGADWSTAINCRDYTLKSGSLTIESNAVKALMAQIQSFASDIDALVTVYYDGEAPSAFGQALSDWAAGVIRPAVSVLNQDFGIQSAWSYESLDVPPATVKVTVGGTVASAIASILGSEHRSADGSITVNLAAGTLTVDYDKLFGGLNDLGPNTDLLDDTVVDHIVAALNEIIDGIAAELPGDIETILKSVAISASGTIEPVVSFTELTRSCIATFFGVCTRWGAPVATEHHSVHGSIALSYAGTASGDPATLWDLLHGEGYLSLSATWDAAEVAALPVLFRLAFDIGSLNIPPTSLHVLGIATGAGARIDDAIKTAVSDGAAAVSAAGSSAVQRIADLLRGMKDVFGGTINVQDEITPTPFRSTSRAFASVAAPATGAFRVTALSLYFGAVGARSTVDLGTAIVGPNRTAAPAPMCNPGFHVAGGVCVPDATGGGGAPGGATGGSTPATPVTPDVDVAGESGEVAPPDAAVQPDIEVADESHELATEEETVAALAETGPRQTGLIALIGMELLLAGVALTRLSARRGRARAVRR